MSASPDSTADYDDIEDRDTELRESNGANDDGTAGEAMDQLDDEAIVEKLIAGAKLPEVPSQKTRRPQPKLDVAKLKGSRGIPELLNSTFANVKLKGNGHEVEDLMTVMKKYEHWAHRLMPNMPFDDVIERLSQHIGPKKETKAYMQRLRVEGLSALEDDFAIDRANRDGEDDQPIDTAASGGVSADARDSFFDDTDGVEDENFDGLLEPFLDDKLVDVASA